MKSVEHLHTSICTQAHTHEYMSLSASTSQWSLITNQCHDHSWATRLRGLVCAASATGCKSLTTAERTNKQREQSGIKNTKTAARIACANRGRDRLRHQHTETKTEGGSEGSGKYKHHARSLIAKSSHKGSGGQDYSHLSHHRRPHYFQHRGAARNDITGQSRH